MSRLGGNPAAARQLLVVALTGYGIRCLQTPDTFRLLDNVDLAIHETGHLVFAPFGEFLTVLGGTLFQLIVPLAFVITFWRRGERYAAYITGWWVAQSCWNIARYAADARAQELPLVGGGEHDWTWLLDSLGWLEQDQTVASTIRVIGALLFGLSMLGAAMNARRPRFDPDEDATAAPAS